MSVELQKRVKPLLMNVDTNIRFESVILSDVNKDKIGQFVEENKAYEKLTKHNLMPMNRLLFYGDSGTGKTFLGKALSNYLKYEMLYVDISQSLSNGEVAENLHTIFEYANIKENCLIFLDECDSIAWNRDAKSAEGGLIRRATNSLFQLMDQMKPNVVIICATNLLHRLDPAFERRFNLKMEFRRPETDIKSVIKKFVYAEFNVIDDISDTIVEKRAEGKLSYYELQGVAERAMKRAVLSDTSDIRMSAIYSDIARTLNIKRRFRTDEREQIDDNAEIDI